MDSSNIHYEFEYNDSMESILSINIIQKTENSTFTFEIKTLENNLIINKIKSFIDQIKNGFDNITLYIINDKFNSQYINYNKNVYNFIINFNGQTSGYYTSKFITNSNLLNMFENLIKDYDEKINILLKEREEKQKIKEENAIKEFLDFFGSYKY